MKEREIFLSSVLISVFSFRTPLMLACYDGSITPIRMLLQFNAQMIIKDKKGQLSWEQQGYKLGTPILKTKSAYICYFFISVRLYFKTVVNAIILCFPKELYIQTMNWVCCKMFVVLRLNFYYSGLAMRCLWTY